MTEEFSYTIGELAEAAGVTPRTVRYYTAEGLLPAPKKKPMDDKRGGRPGMAGGDRGGMGGGGARPPRF